MEFLILKISEDSNIDYAKKALHKIRKKCHPDKLLNASKDEQEKSKHILFLAEEAYKRIEQKNKVNTSLENLRYNKTPFINPIETVFPIFNNIFLSGIPKSKNTYSTSYSYINNNGNVNEEGTINGRQMTRDELKQYTHELQ